MLIFVLVALISFANGQPDSDLLRLKLNFSLKLVGAAKESLVPQNSDLEDAKSGEV